MDDLIISVPRSDTAFVAQLMERMGYYVRNRKWQGEKSKNFRQLLDSMRQSSVLDHEWTLEEINAEIAAARSQMA